MASYVYLNDRFIELSYGFHDVVDLFKKDRFQPFRLAENLVYRKLGNILDVKLYGSYLNPRRKIFIVEYVVRFEDKGSGETRVKIICAENPRKALIEYYREERRGRIKKYI